LIQKIEEFYSTLKITRAVYFFQSNEEFPLVLQHDGHGVPLSKSREYPDLEGKIILARKG
jgi:hypothetical protein